MSDEPEIDDRVEMALRHRITALEEWRATLQEALGLLVIGFIALAIAYGLLIAVLRKKLP